MPEDRQTQSGFLNKTMRMKWVLLLLGIVVIAGLGFWGAKAFECSRIAEQGENKLTDCVTNYGENLAVAVATVGNQAIVDRRWTELQQYADKLVRNRPLSYIAIVDSGGVARVHTDRKYLGKKFEPQEDMPGVVQVSSAVMDQTRQVGTVYIGVNEP